MHAKKIATVAHRLKEYPYNIVSVAARIFLSVNRTFFVPPAEQHVYIKRRKNMQSFIKSKVESKEGYAVAVCYGCDEASEKNIKVFETR